MRHPILTALFVTLAITFIISGVVQLEECTSDKHWRADAVCTFGAAALNIILAAVISLTCM